MGFGRVGVLAGWTTTAYLVGTARVLENSEAVGCVVRPAKSKVILKSERSQIFSFGHPVGKKLRGMGVSRVLGHVAP